MTKKTMIAILGAAMAAAGLCDEKKLDDDAVMSDTPLPRFFSPDYDATREAARENGRNLFVFFTGSDWCGWCKKLVEEVFSRSEFADFATNSYECAVVDFPNDTSRQSDAEKKRNQELQEKFGIKGFPTVVLVDACSEKALYEAGYEAGGASKWVEDFRNGVSRKPLVDKHIKPFTAEHGDVIRAFYEKLHALDDSSTNYIERATTFKDASVAFVEQATALREKICDAEMPEELKDRKQQLLEEIDRELSGARDAAAADVGDIAVKLEAADRRMAASRMEHENRMREMREANRPRFICPSPADAKVDTEYYATIAAPFWRKHIVDAFVPPEEMPADLTNRVLRVREALVRALTKRASEFPTGAEGAEADWLWSKKCRDAGVAIVRYLAMSKEDQYHQGDRIFKETAPNHDDSKDPMLGYLLRWMHSDWANTRLKLDSHAKKENFKGVFDEHKEAFKNVVDIFKAADIRIAESLSLPEGAPELLDDEYWRLIRKGDEKSRLAAVELRPDEPWAMMLLARNYAFSCGKNKEAAEWFNRAVSNSLDRCNLDVGDYLHGQTTRWGGSLDYLFEVLTNTLDNVRTDSAFSFKTAGYALKTIYKWEMEDVPTNTNVVQFVLTPEMREKLFAMFDKYIAAGEQPFLPSVDSFRGMAAALAMQLEDWGLARKYVAQWKEPTIHWRDAMWLRLAAPNGEYLRQINTFLAIANKQSRENTLKMCEAASRGDLESVYEASKALLDAPKMPAAARRVAGQHFFRARKAIQEAAGGWVDAMPTKDGSEANHWWDFVLTDDSGVARLAGKRPKKGYYRILQPLPGIGYEYESTIHFEEKDPKQKEWHIGWGLSHPYVGNCMENSSWAFPYFNFWRDVNGDHFDIESFTAENVDLKDTEEAHKQRHLGFDQTQTVARGDLEKAPTHSFRLRAGGDMFEFEVDGKLVYTQKTSEMMKLVQYCERIRTDGTVYPVWKLFTNTAFSGYRYRRMANSENVCGANAKTADSH